MLRLADKILKTNNPEDAFCDHNKAKDYKGVFFGDDSEKRYYEGGAHFAYKDLCKRLIDLSRKLSPSRIGGTSKTERNDKTIEKTQSTERSNFSGNK